MVYEGCAHRTIPGDASIRRVVWDWREPVLGIAPRHKSRPRLRYTSLAIAPGSDHSLAHGRTFHSVIIPDACHIR